MNEATEEIVRSKEFDEKREYLKTGVPFKEKLQLIVDSGLIGEFKFGAADLVAKHCSSDTILDILPPPANSELDELVNQIILNNDIEVE